MIGGHLDLGVVRNSDLAMLVGSDRDFEDPEGILLHGVRITIPTVYAALAGSGHGRDTGLQVILKSPVRKACWALGAHSR